VLLAKTLRSSTLRLALIAIGVFGTAMFSLIGYVYIATSSYVRGQLDRAIAAEQPIFREAYARGGREALAAVIGQRIADRRIEGAVYLLAGPSFEPVTGNLGAWPRSLNRVHGPEIVDTRDSEPGKAGPPPLRVALETFPDGSHLIVGREIGHLDAFVMSIRAALAGVIALLVVLAGTASFMVTRRTVGRIEAINATCRAIMLSGLDRRIPLRGTGDEWDQLAANLNQMLDRIEKLMADVREVSDNVAHDLRTPLTRMRARLEKACDRARDAERDQRLISDTMADLDSVMGVITALLRISQIEGDDRRAEFRAVNLAEIACDVAELFDAAAEDRGGQVVTRTEDRVVVSGDRDLLFNAVANLVDNAIKHGGEAAQVSVAVAEAESGPFVSVADRGPGIPASERQHVFKRFYRLERSRHAPGNGLGLSLVAAVADLHGARIEMRDNEPGLEFRLWFPHQGTTYSASQSR
jgi:signal transduction histidine kinase